MSKKFTSDSPTWEEIKRLRKPARRTVTLYLNNELKVQRRELLKKIDRAKADDNKLNRNPQAPDLQKRLDQLDEEIKEYGVEFVFEDLGRKRYEELVAQHKPDEELLAQHPEAEFDPKTLAPALVAASLVSPEMTEAEVYEMWDEFSQGDTERLWTAALLTQMEVSSVNFTERDTDDTDDLLLRLTSAQNEESPTPGS